MIKELSCCMIFLAASLVGPAAAQSNQDMDPIRSRNLPEARYSDYTHVFSQSETPTKAAEPVALAVIATWISQHFGLPNTGDLPRLEFVAPEHLVAHRYRGLLPQLPQLPALQQKMLGAERDLLAVYNEEARAIYLSEAWRGESPAEVSILVHEMVHHLQNQAQLKFACLQEREEMAYTAQDRWLGQSGLSLVTEFGIDPFTRLVRTRCMN
jgi:hypothetical protein